MPGLGCPYGENCCWGHVCPNGAKCFHLSKGKCWFKGGESRRLLRSDLVLSRYQRVCIPDSDWYKHALWRRAFGTGNLVYIVHTLNTCTLLC